MGKNVNFDNLIFEGGGVKGIAYAGALEVLEAQGILSAARNVAGTSAGAITATLVALNFSAKEIKEIVMAMDFRKFEDGFNPFRLFSTYGLYKGQVFLNWIEDKINKAGLPKNSTFLDMKARPEFKTLKVFATDLNKESIQEFSAEKTPNTIVAEAVRASMSIPLFFKSWQFSNGNPNDHLFVDGGVLFNYPFDIFKDVDKSLGFYLTNLEWNKEKNDLRKWSLLKYVKYLFDTLLRSQNIQFQENKPEQMKTVIINDLNVSATDFSLSNDMKKKLIHQGKIATQKHLGITDFP